MFIYWFLLMTFWIHILFVKSIAPIWVEKILSQWYLLSAVPCFFAIWCPFFCFHTILNMFHVCLNQCSIAIKGQHNHGNPSKWKYLVGPWLQFQKHSPWPSWQNWESYIPNHIQQEEKVTGCGLGFWNCKSHPQWCTSTNKGTHTSKRPHSLILLKSCIQIYDPMVAILIQITRMS